MRLGKSSAVAGMALLLAAGMARADDARAELQKRIADLDRAILSGDPRRVRPFFASDGIFVTDQGKRIDQRAYVALIANPGTVYKSVKSSSDRLRVFGETAIETGIYDATATVKGKPLRIQIRYTATWLKKNGKWEVIAEQDMDLLKK